MRAVVITGSEGAVGSALVSEFLGRGYHVIGIDRTATTSSACSYYIRQDLGVLDTDHLAVMEAELSEAIGSCLLVGLINNAATQIVAPIGDIDPGDLRLSLEVNLMAPFLMSRLTLPWLSKADGRVLNVGSIHSRQTKPGFLPYAVSKGALETLTRSMAIELGSQVTFNLVEPAAIATPMLKEGFAQRREALQELSSYHPARLGCPAELAQFILAD